MKNFKMCGTTEILNLGIPFKAKTSLSGMLLSEFSKAETWKQNYESFL